MIAKAGNMSNEKIRELQDKLYLAAKTNPKRKFGVLYDKVYREDILLMAYKQVRANKGAHGIDQQTFEDIENKVGISEFLANVRQRLIDKEYKPKPVRRVYIPKPDGSKRPLGIPVIEDRVVQAAVKMIIEPIFEACFMDYSYGFRPQKSAYEALREVYKWLNYKCHWVIDADIKSYFDKIPHDKLIKSVMVKIIDKGIIKLLNLWLKAGVMEEMETRKETTGTPQGGVISPLLSNIYLHWLDYMWEKSGFNKRQHDAHIVRYADDFVILCRENPQKYLEYAKMTLDKLGLELNATKTKIVNATMEEFNFLGHEFKVQTSKRSGKLKTYYYPSRKAMSSVKKKIREVVRTAQHWSLPNLIKERVNPLLTGWGNYFKTGNSRLHFKSITNYATYTLTIMLRKKHKKRGKGWRDHPPSWYHDYHKLVNLNNMVVVDDTNKRYSRLK